LKAHAGEFGPASNIKEAVEKLKVQRIQHGTRAVEDESVMELLIEKDVTLDMCPISNYKLKVIDKWEDHPIKDFVNRGIRCTVSTDDPLSFNNSLVDEYCNLYEKLSFSFSGIADLIANGFRVSDIDSKKKEYYLTQIAQQVAKVNLVDG
jgi:adenosine deaminase